MSDILMKVIGDVTALRERLDNAEARAEVDARNTAGLPMYAGLTAGRVLFAGTDQALADSPGLMFNPVANALAVAGAISAGGTLVVNSLGTGGAASIEVGAGGSGNRYAFIDLAGDDTYGDYGLRILRNNSGPNATSDLSHRGTGALRFITNDGGDISLYPGSSRRLTADGSGVLIETAITQQLLVSNTQTGSGGGYSVSLFAAHPGVSSPKAASGSTSARLVVVLPVSSSPPKVAVCRLGTTRVCGRWRTSPATAAFSTASRPTATVRPRA